MNRFLKFLKLSFSLLLAFLAIRICLSHWEEMKASGSSSIQLSEEPLLLILVAALVPINWWIESLKWKTLTQSISMNKAWSDVLRGISLSLITPNRLGEVVGRVTGSGSKLAQHNYAFLVGSLAQSCVTLSFGLIGLIMYSGHLPFKLPIAVDYLRKPVWSIALAVLVLLGCFFIGKSIPNIAHRLPLPSKWKIYVNSLERLSPARQLAALAYSSLRYLIFLAQYLLALHIFGAEAALTDLAAAVALSYLITALVPATIIGELGVRESVAVLVLAPLCNAATIVPATFLVWLLNLAIPAIIGSGFWIQWKRKPDSIAVK